MKNVWLLGLVCLLLVSCGSGGKEKSGSEDRVCACPGGNSSTPLLTAFLLGLLTALSPCPLATNIAAVGFISVC